MSDLASLSTVDVRLGGRTILSGVDLAIGSGEVVQIVGPNGSGKTTVLRLLATLLRPSSGTARILGADSDGSSIRHVRSRIGLMSHQPGLIDELTLAENLEHFARIASLEVARCEEALRVVGLDEASDTRAGQASFGMRRRAEIAWLLVSKPDLLLLDEARSGLDSDARDLIAVVVDRTRSDGGAVVGVSHEKDGLGLEDSSAQVRSYRLTGGRLEVAS